MKSRYTIIETHPKVLQQKQKNEIVEVGLDAFGQEMTDREILDHVLPMHRAYLAYVGAQKNVMGFATAQLDPTSVDFSIAVHTKAQQNGIYGDLLIRISDLALNTQRQMLTFRTQNPVILKGLRGSLDRLVNIGRIQGYDEQRTFLPNHYGRMLTKHQPVTNISAIDRLFESFDYKSGDAYSFRVEMVQWKKK